MSTVTVRPTHRTPTGWQALLPAGGVYAPDRVTFRTEPWEIRNRLAELTALSSKHGLRLVLAASE